MSSIFGGQKPTLKLYPKQEVEVEFENSDGAYENYFVKVIDVHRKKVTLHAPGSERLPVRLVPGQPVTITTLVDDRLYSYNASVLDSREKEFDVNPPKDVKEVVIPPRDEDFKIEIPIPVEYRAMKTAHKQVAQTQAITPNGLFLQTNLPIPQGTFLVLELEIPNAPDITVKGRAVTSQPDPSGSRKHITEMEYEDIPEQDRDAILNYAIYYQQRRERARMRDSEM